MWMDILMQGTWENTNNSRSFTLKFGEDTFTQKKIEEGRSDEEVTFEYRIVSFDTDHEGANFVVNRTDSGNLQKPSLLESLKKRINTGCLEMKEASNGILYLKAV